MLMVALLTGLVGFGPMPHSHLSLGLSGGAFIPGFHARERYLNNRVLACKEV